MTAVFVKASSAGPRCIAAIGAHGPIRVRAAKSEAERCRNQPGAGSGLCPVHRAKALRDRGAVLRHKPGAYEPESDLYDDWYRAPSLNKAVLNSVNTLPLDGHLPWQRCRKLFLRRIDFQVQSILAAARLLAR